MSRISNVALFNAVFAAMRKQLQAGNAPTRIAFPGQSEFVRTVEKKYIARDSNKKWRDPHDSGLDPSKIAGNLIARDAARDTNRFTGVGPHGRMTNHGGLYISGHVEPNLAEVMWYGRGLPLSRILPDKVLIRLHVTQPLVLLDLSLNSGDAARFFKTLEANRDVSQAMQHGEKTQKGSSLQDLMLHSTDYTVARAIGIATAMDPAVDGLLMFSARGTGENCVLYGPDGHPIDRKIVAESVTTFGDGKDAAPTVHGLDYDRQSKEYSLKKQGRE